MKTIPFILIILGTALTLSFQNCSQGNFESSSTDNEQSQNTKVISDQQIQDFLNRDRIEICPTVMCAAPPEGCRYEQESTTNLANRSRCNLGCGRLVCDRQPPVGIVPPKEPVICPMIACSPVPEGCSRVAVPTTVRDTNGCDLNCGEVKCDDRSTEPVNPIDEVSTDSGASDSAQLAANKPRICPMVSCAAPPEGCFYRPTSRISGSNSCPGCGELICRRPPIGTDLPPVPME